MPLSRKESAIKDLRDAYLNNGYQSIPVIAFFDKDWNEVGRWYERAHAATAKAAQIRAKTLDLAPKDDKAKQDAAMNDFRAAVNAEYHAPGGALWRAAAAKRACRTGAQQGVARRQREPVEVQRGLEP